MATSSGVDLSLSGLASGFDWKSFVQQMAQAERSPETKWLQNQAALNQRNSAFGNIKTLLTTLQTNVTAINDPTLYDSSLAQVSDPSLGSATASAGAALGTFTFNIGTLATAATLNGTADVAAKLSDGTNLSTLTLANAGFTIPVTAGTFTVNGQQVTVATTDTIQQVFDKIATATNNKVAASYDPTTDKLTFASSDNSEIILGSATDSSNFLQVSRMVNNGTGTITSSVALGGVKTTSPLASSNLATAVSDGGSGAGAFTINGVTINYNASTDSINNVLSRINNSSAGVTATYNSVNDKFVLTNKATGDIGVAMQDVTGNFLAATGLSAGTIQHGTNLTYSVNGSDSITSQSNTITQDSSGVTGLSVTALKANSTVTATVNSDTNKIQTAINSFISAYNSVQSFIDNQTASSTDSTGKVTAGILATDRSATDITQQLRKLTFSPITGLADAINQLGDMGIQTNGQDNTLKVADQTALTNALTNNLAGVKQLFTSTGGLASQLTSYLKNTIGDTGSLVAHQDSLTKQSSAIDAQIAALEKQITADSARLTTEFVNMESAQASINQQTQYLQQQISKGTL